MIGRVDAVVLAGGGRLKGGRAASREARSRGVDRPDGSESAANKSLLRIGQRLMVDYVLEALAASPEVAQIVLAAPPKLQEAYRTDGRLLFAAAGETLLGSLAAGAAALEASPEPQDWLLICTGDIPFLTAAAVADFIDRCRRRQADFYYPIISRRAAEQRFPGVRRTYARLRDGVFTGGNLFLVRRAILGEALLRAEGFIRLRKKPVAMARLVGPGFLFAYLLGCLTIDFAERRVSRLVGYQGAAVISDYPEIGVDVDKPADLDLARRILAP